MKKHPETPEPLKHLIGRTYEDAKLLARESNRHIRASKIEGKPCIGTRDLKLDRINVCIENGVVVAAFFG